jgi:hypothetical protein
VTDTALEERDEAVAEAITSGRSLRSVRKQFGLSTTELDSALERLWPIDLQSRIRMIKGDLGKLDKLTEVFYEKALAVTCNPACSRSASGNASTNSSA